MAFAAEKCELIHFNKGRRQWQNAGETEHAGRRVLQVPRSMVGQKTFLEGLQNGSRKEAEDARLRTVTDCSENVGPWPSQGERGVHKVYPQRHSLRSGKLSRPCPAGG